MIDLLALLPCPLAIAASALIVRGASILTRIAAGLICLQLGIAIRIWLPRLSDGPDAAVSRGFSADPVAAVFVLLTTLVVACALTHSVGFFAREERGEHPPSKRQVAQFYIFTPLFLIAMYVVVTADNLGYLWIGMEATTLLSAPLVYFHRSRTSLEATWKYVIICSVGIAFAFFGTAVLYAGSQQSGFFQEGSLSLSALSAHAQQIPAGFLRLAFVFILLGYGTKAGLFPLHNWLPDAHSEAPAPASAILSGAMLNCALVVLWRLSHLMNAAGLGLLVRETLLPMSAATVIAAALFLLKQRDLKRLLAYSSMENSGLIAGAIAIGSSSGFILQAINHSLVKVALFLLAGNLLQAYRSKAITDIRGVIAARPLQGALLLLLGVAVAGSPPFGSFLSEWQILSAAADMHRFGAVVAFSLALALAFIALSIHLTGMLFGKPSPDRADDQTNRQGISLILVPGLLLAAALCLGVMLTPRIVDLAAGLAR